MRPLHLKLAATGLLLSCALFILRQNVWQDRPDSETNQPRLAQRPNAPPRRHDPLPTAPDLQARRATPAETALQPRPTTATRPAPTASQPTGPLVAASQLPVGVRLADDVKLPAVILALGLALGNPNRDPEHKTPAPIAAAMQGIVDRFYQELATSVRDQSPAGSQASSDAADASGTGVGGEENTVVIKPGPAVDQARARANETYRTLFGDEAYNRMVMNAAMEVMSPASPASGKP